MKTRYPAPPKAYSSLKILMTFYEPCVHPAGLNYHPLSLLLNVYFIFTSTSCLFLPAFNWLIRFLRSGRFISLPFLFILARSPTPDMAHIAAFIDMSQAIAATRTLSITFHFTPCRGKIYHRVSFSIKPWWEIIKRRATYFDNDNRQHRLLF